VENHEKHQPGSSVSWPRFCQDIFGIQVRSVAASLVLLDSKNEYTLFEFLNTPN
jgi:hypothetical protein